MNLAGLHILLAEDNPTNQMVAAQMLAALGASSSLAVDGVEALELARREQFDLGLIDIEMPRLPGTEVIRQLRAGPPPHCDMPLIALTAYVMREHRQAIAEAGADGVIPKPLLSIEQLGEDILKIVAERDEVGRRARIRAAAVARTQQPMPMPRAGSRPPSPAPANAPAPTNANANATGDGIDRKIFETLKRSIGSAAMHDLLGKMDHDVETVGGRIRHSVAEHQLKQLRDATHMLVAVAGTVGAVALQKHAECLNSAAHSGEFAEIDRLGAIVVSEIDLLRAFICSERKGTE